MLIPKHTVMFRMFVTVFSMSGSVSGTSWKIWQRKVRKQETVITLSHTNIRSGILIRHEEDDSFSWQDEKGHPCIRYASFYHCLLLEDHLKRYQYWLEGSLCNFKPRIEMEEKDHYLDSCFEELLSRLLLGINSNNLECIISIIWII